MNQPLPTPALSICVDLAERGDSEPDFSSIPAKPGVFCIEDAEGGTLALASTANLRRMIAAKLAPPDESGKATRRANLRAVARRVLAVRVGSAFEADWAYLQLARQRLPSTYRAFLDRWQAWFIECDAGSTFPQWTKTVHPRVAEGAAAAFGPFADKQAAGRYIEMLQDAFDLCRYHHLLVQAPNAVACVYKEMGRCPAPCDGTISLDAYRAMIDESIEFAGTPIEEWRSQTADLMNEAAATHEFELAQRLRMRLERTVPATRAEFAYVNRLERFAFVAVMPGETPSMARLFLASGGWVEPLLDLPVKAKFPEIEQAVATIACVDKARRADFSQAGLENIGVMCRHWLRPKRAKVAGSFLRLPQDQNPQSLQRSLRALNRSLAANPSEESIVEHDSENIANEHVRR